MSTDKIDTEADSEAGAPRSVLGRAFYLMGLVDGWSPMDMGDSWPEPFESDLEARAGRPCRFDLVDADGISGSLDR